MARGTVEEQFGHINNNRTRVDSIIESTRNNTRYSCFIQREAVGAFGGRWGTLVAGLELQIDPVRSKCTAFGKMKRNRSSIYQAPVWVSSVFGLSF